MSQKHPEAYARLKDGPGGNQDEVLEDLLQGTERRSVIITKCKSIMKKTVTGTFFGSSSQFIKQCVTAAK